MVSANSKILLKRETVPFDSGHSPPGGSKGCPSCYFDSLPKALSRGLISRHKPDHLSPNGVVVSTLIKRRSCIRIRSA